MADGLGHDNRVFVTLVALKSEFTQRRQDAAMKVGASTTKISMSEVRTTYTDGNDAPIYNVEIVVTYILGGQDQQQRLDEPWFTQGP